MISVNFAQILRSRKTVGLSHTPTQPRVMNTSDYIDSAEKQMSDQRYYKKIQSDPTSNHAIEISQTLSEMKRHEYIDEKTFEYLDTTEVKAGRCYLQTKTHKEGYRPITFTNGHPTERISGVLNYYYHVRSFATALPSYVQDTTDYISKTKQSDLPENALLLAMDVVSLYTNIPHYEGIEACKQARDTGVDPDIPTTYLVKLLTHVLKLNNFEFYD
jgi:hypothetical protein